MTSILFGIVGTCGSQFKRNYIKKQQKNFVYFFFNFGKIYQVLTILENKMVVVINVFPKLGTAKDTVRQMFKEPRFRTPFDSQQVKGPKGLRNLHERTFITFLHHSEGKVFGKRLS